MGNKCGKCSAKQVDQTIKNILNNIEKYHHDLEKVHQALTHVVPAYDTLTKDLKKKVKYLEMLYFTGRNLQAQPL